MLISKTEKGQTALQERSQELRVRERQILVMIDGQRTGQDFIGLFGKESSAVLSRLHEGGFIRISEPAVLPKSCKPSGFVSSSSFGASDSANATEKRPSMSLAKRYLILRLQAVKDSNTKRFIASLERCTTSDELVEAMIHTMMYLQSELVSADCSDLAAKLSQIVPPKYWQRIQSDLALSPSSCC
ncbi:MAG: hypothetical protein EAZ37_13270 [Burkholderiales bacterium]|nr:MAG: hypothetical protein EAZ37_13270 [Burkholderiales bacterium]